MILRLFKHTTLYALGPQIPKIASIFVLPIITRDLTPLDYGISGLVSAYIGAFAALKLLGLEMIIINYYFKKPKNFQLIWSHLFSFLTRYLFLFAFLVVTILYFILRNEVDDNMLTLLVLITVPIILFDLTIMYGSRYYQLKQNFKPVMFISAASGLITVFLNLYTISYLKMGYMGWYVSLFLSTLFTFLCYSYPVFFKLKITPFIKPRFKFIKRYLKVSSPLIPDRYGHYLLSSSDRVVMDALKIPTSDLGLYTIGYNIGAYSALLSEAVGVAVGPMFLEQMAKRTKQAYNYIRELSFLLQVLFLVITISGSIWAKEIFQFLISDSELALSYDVAIFVIMAQNHAPLRFYFNNIIVFKEDTKVLWKITFTAGIINIILNLIFVPIYGYLAAAVTTIISLLFLTTFGFYFRIYKTYNQKRYYPILWMGISLIFAFLVYYIRDFSIEFKILCHLILIGLSIYPIIYFLNRLKKHS